MTPAQTQCNLTLLRKAGFSEYSSLVTNNFLKQEKIRSNHSLS